MKPRLWEAPMLVLVSAIPLAIPLPRAYAQADAVSGPCDEVLSQLGVATARQVPLAIKDAELEDGRRRSDPGSDLLSASGPTTIVLITPACRAETSRGAASSVVAAARAMLQKSEPGWIDFGRRILCAMQDPGSARELETWMNDDDHPGARAICLAELATWPGVEQQRNTIFARLVHREDMFEWGSIRRSSRPRTTSALPSSATSWCRCWRTLTRTTRAVTIGCTPPSARPTKACQPPARARAPCCRPRLKQDGAPMGPRHG